MTFVQFEWLLSFQNWPQTSSSGGTFDQFVCCLRIPLWTLDNAGNLITFCKKVSRYLGNQLAFQLMLGKKTGCRLKWLVRLVLFSGCFRTNTEQHRIFSFCVTQSPRQGKKHGVLFFNVIPRKTRRLFCRHHLNPLTNFSTCLYCTVLKIFSFGVFFFALKGFVQKFDTERREQSVKSQFETLGRTTTTVELCKSCRHIVGEEQMNNGHFPPIFVAPLTSAFSTNSNQDTAVKKITYNSVNRRVRVN